MNESLLPTNLSIDPITQTDLGSLSNYRSSNALNRIENSVMKNMTAKNKSLYKAIEADPTSTNALLLTLGQGLQEGRVNRELSDLRASVRGSEVSKQRAKAEKAFRDNGIREVNSVIKQIAPELQGRIDPNILLANFVDPQTGKLNYQNLGSYLEKENANYQKNRVPTLKDKTKSIKDLSTLQAQYTEAVESGDVNTANRILGVMTELEGTLHGEDAEMTFAFDAKDPDISMKFIDYIQDKIGIDQTYNKDIDFTVNINGTPKTVKLQELTLDGNKLIVDDETIAVLSPQQKEAFLKAQTEATQAGEKVHQMYPDGNAPVEAMTQPDPSKEVDPESLVQNTAPPKTHHEQVEEINALAKSDPNSLSPSSAVSKEQVMALLEKSRQARLKKEGKPSPREESANKSANYMDAVNQGKSPEEHIPTSLNPMSKSIIEGIEKTIAGGGELDSTSSSAEGSPFGPEIQAIVENLDVEKLKRLLPSLSEEVKRKVLAMVPGLDTEAQTLETDPVSNYSRADAERDQTEIVDSREREKKQTIADKIKEENLAKVQKQMERSGTFESRRKVPIDEKIGSSLDAIRNSVSGQDIATANVTPEPEAKESDGAKETRRRNLIRTERQNALGKSDVDEPSMLGKATGWVGDKLESASTQIDNTVGSTQDKIVKEAKEFMAHEGMSGLSGNEAIEWATNNWQKFNKWRQGGGADTASAKMTADKMQSERAKTGIDPRYLEGSVKRNSKGVFRDDVIPEGIPPEVGNLVKRGLTLAGKNGLAKDVRPGFVVALMGTENAKYDPNAEGIEKDKVTGQNVIGGKAQGLGMVQMTVGTAKGTPLGKLRFKGKSDKEIGEMLKSDPELNIAISTQFAQKIYNVFKRNKYTKKFSPFDMEMLVGTAYNNRGESFERIVDKAYAENPRSEKTFEGLMHIVGNLDKQTRRHIPRLRSKLNKQRKRSRTVAGVEKEKSIMQLLKDTKLTNKQNY